MLESLNPNLQAIIFDHDGTLVDSEPTHHACWCKALQPFSVELPLHWYQTYLTGIPSIQSAEWIVNKFSLPISPQALLSQKVEYLKQALKQAPFPLMQGALQVLQSISDRYQLAVASGAGRHEVQHSLDQHNIAHYFRTSVTKDDVPNNKPSPDSYLQAAQELGLAPQDCIAIEDSDTGQIAARAAGMPCIRLNTTSNLPKDEKVFTIHSLLDILGTSP